ncbi:MAG TPA: MauE/DoxX family redox-associated membrane protein [Bacteroidota bacterium]|nr:MauE/DoxX family redox-associated membrane protein [Bacteroidota bacterium]
MTARVLAIVLGVFYITSGVGKLLDVLAFFMSIYNYGVPGDALTYVAIAVPPVEILLGFGLLLFVRTRVLALVSMIFLVLFTAGYAYAHFANGLNHCGCFGVISALDTTPLVSFGRNILFLGLSFLLFRRPVPPSPAPWRLGFLSLVGAASFALSGLSLVYPIYSSEPWLNKKIQDTPLGPLVHTSPDSTYLVFAMSVTCPHCWNATENVKAYKTMQRVHEIVALGIGTDSAAAIYKSHFNPNFDVRLITAKQMGEITGGGIPKLFFVRHDSVVRTENREIPSPWSEELDD